MTKVTYSSALGAVFLCIGLHGSKRCAGLDVFYHLLFC
jgi:hypothetical protein